jgi:sugar/nucleoside kinase (ribokinase family)
MALTREQIAELTAKKLAAAAANLSQTKAVIGLDGFVDEIIAVVDKRASLSEFTPFKTIDQFGEKVVAAAKQSSNFELVVKQMKLGGNGPIMANALACFGLTVTYIGNLGYPTLHPVFEDMAKRAKVISIAEPGHTDALEFEDGKLMLGKISVLNEITWDFLVQRVGLAVIQQLVDQASLFGFVNWTMIPYMGQIWEKLRTDIVPKASKRPRKFFVDLADPEKRSHKDIADALAILTRFQGAVDVILGLNLKESGEIAEVLGLPARSEAEIEQTAKAIRERLNIYCCVIHPRGGAAAATATGSAKIAGPFVQQPKISTGAGDHFNAGFAMGQVLGFSLEESLCTGVGVSGYYVRTAISPSAVQLSEFVAKLPPPQG